MNKRTQIPRALRSKILIGCRHACCVCGRSDIQIHHINGNNSDNSEENLAVLCLIHHNQATAPQNLTAALTAQQVRHYKTAWEDQCRQHALLIARSRTAFFMVDYKNAERIRELYSQLSSSEFLNAYHQLREQFQQEDKLRKDQGFDVSLEPNTAWIPPVRDLLEWVKTGEPHPAVFKDWKGHPRDPLWPTGFQGSTPTFAYYDIWCQIMIRALVVCRGVYDINDLMALQEPMDAQLSGKLASIDGFVRGKVAIPDKWEKTPISKTTLIVKCGNVCWQAVLELKTHYVYSMTAAGSLSGGRENGIVIIRNIDSVETKKGNRVVRFSCTPLILGCGGGGVLKIPGASVM